MTIWFTIPTVARLKATTRAHVMRNGSWVGSTGDFDRTTLIFFTWWTSVMPKLAPYQGNSKNLGTLPCRQVREPAQKKRGLGKRIRTFSMNSNMGDGNGKLWYGANAHQIYIKSGDIADPSNKWVVVDEHPDSMNDGCFFTNMTTSNPSYVDLPGTMHNNACGYGFADGHSEIKKWNHEMKSNITFSRSWSPRGAGAKADWLWHQERSSAPKNRR